MSGLPFCHSLRYQSVAACRPEPTVRHRWENDSVTHDLMCPFPFLCLCDFIAKVRADEQERQVTRLREQGVTVYSLSVSDPSLLPTLP